MRSKHLPQISSIGGDFPCRQLPPDAAIQRRILDHFSTLLLSVEEHPSLGFCVENKPCACGEMDAIALNFCSVLFKDWLSKGKIHPTKACLFSLLPSLLSFSLLGPGGEASSLLVSCLLNSLFN